MKNVIADKVLMFDQSNCFYNTPLLLTGKQLRQVSKGFNKSHGSNFFEQ